MGRGNEINVVRLSLLHLQHNFNQSPVPYIRVPFIRIPLADLIVLAKHTAQTAVRKKDRPRPSGPGDDRLFSMMKAISGDFNIRAGPAESTLPGQAVYSTTVAAEPAGDKKLVLHKNSLANRLVTINAVG